MGAYLQGELEITTCTFSAIYGCSHYYFWGGVICHRTLHWNTMEAFQVSCLSLAFTHIPNYTKKSCD